MLNKRWLQNSVAVNEFFPYDHSDEPYHVVPTYVTEDEIFKVGDTLGDFTDANRGDLPLRFCSQVPNIVVVRHFENSCDQIAQHGWLTLLANHGNGHTYRMLANLITDIWYARYQRVYTLIAAIGENRNPCTGNTRRFSPIATIGVQNQSPSVSSP